MKFHFYKDIQHLHDGTGRIPYEILLYTIEWRKFRENIPIRDSYTCTICRQVATEKLHPDDRVYLRKPTQEELARKTKLMIMDLGNGVIVKMQQPMPTAILIKNPVILHVHHLYYIDENLPWEYDFEP